MGKMILGRRGFLAGLSSALIAAPAVLMLPLEMGVRGVPLVTDQDLVAELMRRLDTHPSGGHLSPDDRAPFYRASPFGWEGGARNYDWIGKPDFERVS